MGDYNELKAKILTFLAEGRILPCLSVGERADFAYGNTKLSNEEVTQEMVDGAMDRREDTHQAVDRHLPGLAQATTAYELEFSRKTGGK